MIKLWEILPKLLSKRWPITLSLPNRHLSRPNRRWRRQQQPFQWPNRASLASSPDSGTWLEYAFMVVFVTSGLHFGFTLLGFVQPGYEPHPVGPKVLFLYSDFVMACALGATLTAYILDHSPDTNRTMAYIGNGTVMGTQVFCVYKTYTLVTDVDAGKRDPVYGALRA